MFIFDIYRRRSTAGTPVKYERESKIFQVKGIYQNKNLDHVAPADGWVSGYLYYIIRGI